MISDKKLDALLRRALVIDVCRQTKMVMMSDVHRSDGSAADNFFKNQNAFMVALRHYDKEGFTYVELGDADELWENTEFEDILNTYGNIFQHLSQLYGEGRYLSLFGNHDMVKSDPKWVKKHLSSLQLKHSRESRPLFPGIRFEEAILLRVAETGEKLLLIHGHQVDPINSTYWRLARFLVRHLWRPLEALGMQDPLSASKNNLRRIRIEENLAALAQKTGCTVVAGHTHQSIFPETGTPPYYNDGSCVHPRCITALELSGGALTLVKWCVQADDDGTLRIVRTVLAEAEKSELPAPQ